MRVDNNPTFKNLKNDIVCASYYLIINDNTNDSHYHINKGMEQDLFGYVQGFKVFTVVKG